MVNLEDAEVAAEYRLWREFNLNCIKRDLGIELSLSNADIQNLNIFFDTDVFLNDEINKVNVEESSEICPNCHSSKVFSYQSQIKFADEG
jgi:DNA-directed RNA polymerase subunit M/transcription elongation factor TFIIS